MQINKAIEEALSKHLLSTITYLGENPSEVIVQGEPSGHCRVPTTMFMPNLYRRFPDILGRGIEVLQVPDDRVVEQWEFEFAYRQELIKRNGKVGHKDYYKLSVDKNLPEFVLAQYVVFSGHTLDRMVERDIGVEDIFRALLAFETPQYSYDGSRLTHYEDVTVVFKVESGLYEIITVYKVDSIYEDCYFEPIKGIDWENVQGPADLFQAFVSVIGETNPHRVGKAALNLAKLLAESKVPEKSLFGDSEQAIAAFSLIWSCFKIALWNGHPGALGWLQGFWGTLKTTLWAYPKFQQDYGERYYKLCNTYQDPTLEEDFFPHVEQSIERMPLSTTHLMYVLVVRLRDHAYNNNLKLHINSNILTVLRYASLPLALFALYIVAHYVQMRKLKDLQEDLQPFLLEEIDKAFFAKVDPKGKASLKWSQLYGYVMEEDRYFDSAQNSDVLLKIACMYAGLRLDMEYINHYIFQCYVDLYSELYGQKIFSKFLENAPVELNEAIEPFRHWTLESALDAFFFRNLKYSLRFEAKSLNPKEFHFSDEIVMFRDSYKQGISKLLSAYIEILQRFNKVEEEILDGNYIGAETFEERQELLRICARDLFTLGFSSVIEDTDDGEASAWFTATVSPQIENAGFLALGIQGPQGVQLMRKLLTLSNLKDAPVLFKVYITLLLGQYSLHITENVANAITYLEYLKSRPIQYLVIKRISFLNFAFERLAQQCEMELEYKKPAPKKRRTKRR